jgi:hypothetical protein
VASQVGWSAVERRAALAHAVRVISTHRLASFGELRPVLVARADVPPELEKRSALAVRLCVAAFVAANRMLEKALHFVDWRRARVRGSLAERIVRRRGLLFDESRMSFMHSVLGETSVESSTPTVTIDRIHLAALAERASVEGDAALPFDDAAAAAATTGDASVIVAASSTTSGADDGDELGRDGGASALERDVARAQTSTVFGSAFAQLADVPAARLRPARPSGSEPHYAIKVVFKGENVEGEGGPYRQFFTDISRELSHGAVPLFVPSPNAQAQVGDLRDRFVPRPSARSPTLLAMFAFLGRLMGVALRTGVVLPLALPMYVWRPLAGVPPTADDLRQIDGAFYRHLAYLTDEATHAQLAGAEQSIFARFVVALSDGSRRELVAGGASRDVSSKEDVQRYVALAERARLTESRQQVAAIRRGLLRVVPRAALALLTPEALERGVCGEPLIDIALLRRHTLYSGVDKDAPHVLAFWRVLESFTPSQRRRFVRFAWAQERLPATDAEFVRAGTRMLLKPYQGAGTTDSVFPRADTCFFNVMLPAYSSEEILRQRLLTAIMTDSDSMNADVVSRLDDDADGGGGDGNRRDRFGASFLFADGDEDETDSDELSTDSREHRDERHEEDEHDDDEDDDDDEEDDDEEDEDDDDDGGNEIRLF